MAPFPARRVDNPEPLPPDTPSYSRIEPEIEELASRLAEQGIQSTELVLDLVLHDLADEARQAVGATGAAIALEREGELVCRAAAGTTAPDLGIRIHIESGLSGVCVKQGSTQICRDTDADDRVDAEACRQLGVRSIVVIPLFSVGGIIGIFEVFSAQPNAFSAEHVQRLEALSAAAAQTIKAAREKLGRASEQANSAKAMATQTPELSVASIMQRVSPIDPAVRALRWIVISLAVPLVVLIGFDLGWHRAHTPVRSVIPAQEEQPSFAERSAENAPANPAQSVTSPAKRKYRLEKPKPAEDVVSQGGLVIYQNGKVIYREEPTAKGKPPEAEPTPAPPSKNADHVALAPTPEPPAQAENTHKTTTDTSASTLPPGITGGRLLHSVRPKYPAQAVVEKLQGSVILHGIVGEDGAIRDLKLVRGDPLLSQAALEAVQQWRYEPYRKQGAAISMPIDITIDFNLPK